MATTLPTKAEHTILCQFVTFPYLTVEHLTRLLYSSGSARYVSAKLKTLTEAKFLHRLERETINVPYIYCLGIRGVRYVKSLGCDIPPLHPSEHTQICLWLELDMGTIDQKPFRKKVSALIEYCKEEYVHAFGTPSLTIVFATPKGQHRVRSLQTWIQQELTRGQLESYADLFRILCIPERNMCPETLFLSPVCVRPFDTNLFPLIEF